MQIEVTSKCTSECVHCYNFWRKEECGSTGNFGALSNADVKTIMQKLADAEVFHVVVTGGEPLVNFQATMLCIELARSANMAVGLNSNLILLTKERATELKRVGLTHILTSILGPNAEIHDKITQRKGSFEKLMAGTNAAHQAGLRVSANMVVSQLNFDQVRATAKLVAGLGIKSFMATKAGCPGNCSDFSQIAPSHEQVITLFNDLCWANESLELRVDTLEPVPLCGLDGVKRPDFFAHRKCTAGMTAMTVSHDGSVRACSHLDESYGNLLTEELTAIWARMSFWSQGEQIPVECSGCRLLGVCGSGCRMEAKMSSGKINGLDPFTQLDKAKDVAGVLAPLKKLPAVTPIKSFKTSKFRLRQEDFGGVLVAGVSYVYLDRKGFEILKQLNQETAYDLTTTTINWNGLDPEKFVSGLIRRRVVSSV